MNDETARSGRDSGYPAPLSRGCNLAPAVAWLIAVVALQVGAIAGYCLAAVKFGGPLPWSPAGAETDYAADFLAPEIQKLRNDVEERHTEIMKHEVRLRRVERFLSGLAKIKVKSETVKSATGTDKTATAPNKTQVGIAKSGRIDRAASSLSGQEKEHDPRP